MKRINIHKRNNTKHSKYKHTYYQNTHTYTHHILQNKLKQPQYKIHGTVGSRDDSHKTVWSNHIPNQVQDSYICANNNNM